MDDKLLRVLRRIETGEIRSAQIYELTDTYYQCVVCKIDECEDDADEPTDVSYPEELLKPLSERKSGIAEALVTLLDRGCDADGSDGYSNALMLAVGNGDEPMTAFLLGHDADPHTWPDIGAALPEQNFYLEDMDIHYMDACWTHDEKRKDALFSAARTFVKTSGIQNFGGLCLLVRNGDVSVKPPRKKF